MAVGQEYCAAASSSKVLDQCWQGRAGKSLCALKFEENKSWCEIKEGKKLRGLWPSNLDHLTIFVPQAVLAIMATELDS